MQSSLITEMDDVLDGQTPAVAMPMFSTVDHATPSYVRNPDWLLAGVEGASALNVCTSTGNTYRKAVWLTPHVCMISWHTRSTGLTYRWVGMGNQVGERSASALPAGLTGYATYHEFIRLKDSRGYDTDIGLFRVAAGIPEGVDCLPIAAAADHQALSQWAWALDIPLMGLLGGAVTHPNRVASPRLLYSRTTAKPWVDAEWFEEVANYDSGSLIGYLQDGQFAACLQLFGYGQGNAGIGENLPSLITQINQGIADLGYPGEQVTVVGLAEAN